jgi:acyl-coenzyme A thioesterase PaaI-like protein
VDWKAHPRLFRFFANFHPAIRGTGARIAHIESDWSAMRIQLPLNWRTRNYVGTIFGGSLYSSVDPWHMILLMHNLGPDYLVWDKSASVRFRKPGRSTLFADCRLPEGEIEEIHRLLHHEKKVDRTYHVDLVDDEGEVHAQVEKVVQVRKKAHRGDADPPS